MSTEPDEEHPDIIISKEEAVFWMDSNGQWNNEGGRFELKRIIRLFNESIAKDGDGYYVTQMNGDRREKVYFPYEDTVLFAIDILKGDPTIMRLNTGKRLPLHPDRIFRAAENLYTIAGDEWIKFSERSLLKLVPMIDTETDPWRIRWKGREYPVLKRPDHQ